VRLGQIAVTLVKDISVVFQFIFCRPNKKRVLKKDHQLYLVALLT